MENRLVLILSEYLRKLGIPLFIVRSYGFVGYLRIVVPEHTSNIKSIRELYDTNHYHSHRITS